MLHCVCWVLLLIMSTFLASYKILLPFWTDHQHVLNFGPAWDGFANSRGSLFSQEATASTDDIITLPLEWGPMPEDAILYTTISLGTPPQPFRLQVDLSWGGLAVRSVVCKSRGLWGDKTDCVPLWKEHWPGFNRSASSSSSALYADAVTQCSQSLWCGAIRGNLSLDALQSTSLNVSGIVLGEIEDFQPYFLMTVLDLYDGIIGFGPPGALSHIWYNGSIDGSGATSPPSSAIPLPNLLHQVLDSHPVSVGHKNMLLRFPTNNKTQGTLTIGEAVPAALDFSLPLEDCGSTSPHCTDTWDVKLNALRLLGGLPKALALDLPLSITTEPKLALGLPRQIAGQILDYLDVLPDEFWGAKIKCWEREYLPDIALEFAGHELVLGWQDYTALYDDPGNPDAKPECAVTIAAVEYGQKSFIGMRLLQKYDVVFDMEKSVVGFKAVKDKSMLQEM